MDIKQIAVLLTCHNRKEKTVSCLTALFACDVPENIIFKVFLVDDGSTDGTAATIESQFTDVKIIQGDGTLYWNRGMYLCWKAAAETLDFDYYLWLNDDTFVFPNAIEGLIKISEQTDNRAIICGAICSDLEIFTYGLLQKSAEPISINSENKTGSLMNGNCVLIPKVIFNDVGNLDPTFPHAIGDYDYGLRAIQKGYQIMTTEEYIGTCNKNERLPQWCYADISFYRRLQKLYSPLGNAHPYYFFIFENRHFNFFVATKHFLSIHLRVLIPSLWKN